MEFSSLYLLLILQTPLLTYNEHYQHKILILRLRKYGLILWNFYNRKSDIGTQPKEPKANVCILFPSFPRFINLFILRRKLLYSSFNSSFILFSSLKYLFGFVSADSYLVLVVILFCFSHFYFIILLLLYYYIIILLIFLQ